MKINDLWMQYEADKRILGFSPHTLKSYSLQLKMLVCELGELEIEEVSLNLLKEYLGKQSERLKASSSLRASYSIRAFPFSLCI